MSTHVELPHYSDRLPQKRLWFGTAAAAAAWAIQGFVCFLISTQACANGEGVLGPLSPAGVRVLLGCITTGLLAVAIWGGVTSFHNWRAISERRRLTQSEGYGREEFMSLIGVFVTFTLGVGIVWAGIPMILLGVCVNSR